MSAGGSADGAAAGAVDSNHCQHGQVDYRQNELTVQEDIEKYSNDTEHYRERGDQSDGIVFYFFSGLVDEHSQFYFSKYRISGGNVFFHNHDIVRTICSGDITPGLTVPYLFLQQGIALRIQNLAVGHQWRILDLGGQLFQKVIIYKGGLQICRIFKE